MVFNANPCSTDAQPVARRTVLGRLLAGTTLAAAAGNSLADSPAERITTAPEPTLVLHLPAVLQGNAFADIKASVRNADGSLTAVQPQWTSSNPILATISRSGVLATGTIKVDSAVVITATVVDQGVTRSANQTVFLSLAAARPTRVELLGSRSLQSGAQLRLRVVAHYDDQSYRPVRPTSWTLHSDNSEAITVILSGGISVDFARGILNLNTIDRQYALDISATYIEGGVTVVGRLDLVATTQASTLTGLRIISTTGVLHAGDAVPLKALGLYEDQSLKGVSAVWQVDHGAVQISPTGMLTAGSVAQDGPVLVSASLTEGGITTTAEFPMLLQQATSNTALQLEVEATGPRSRYGLSAWVRLPASTAPLQGDGFAARTAAAVEGYKLFVVAVVPGGAAPPSVYMLNRSKEWQGLSYPLAEYMTCIGESRDYLVDIFDQIDSRLIAGTAVYVGYGTSDTEMLAQGRYRVLQVL